jgi:hypothetical protein
VLNWVLDRVPGVKKWDVDPDTVQRRFGPTFGDPMVLGLLIGIVLGILGFLPPMLAGGSFTVFLVSTLGLGINLAAVMFLLPRMVSILMEGLIPISESAREFMQARASGREVYIGLDSAILIGHPAVISSALILVPIAILLSVILPGNRVLLFADLAVIPFVLAILGPICRGNIVRIVIIGTVILTAGFYFGNAIAPSDDPGCCRFWLYCSGICSWRDLYRFNCRWLPVAATVLLDNRQEPGMDRVDPHRSNPGCCMVLLQPQNPELGNGCWWSDCGRTGCSRC